MPLITTVTIKKETAVKIDEMAKEKRLSKKDFIESMVNFCYYNGVDVQSKNLEFSIQKRFKSLEKNIMILLENQPQEFRRIVEDDQNYHPLFESYDALISLFKKHLDMEKFLRELSENERDLFLKNEQKIIENITLKRG
ncbi:BfmA/BtgA family mobilization protein [Ornithobacterium rhinotracheale]